MIRKYSQIYGVDPSLVRAVMRHESGFNATAVSPKGAQGLMQLMPGTAALMGVKDPFDPEQNIAGGVGYLRHCLDRFQHNVPLAVAAYNAGPESVAKCGAIPPYHETQLFVNNVMGSYAGPNQLKPGPRATPRRPPLPRRKAPNYAKKTPSPKTWTRKKPLNPAVAPTPKSSRSGLIRPRPRSSPPMSAAPQRAAFNPFAAAPGADPLPAPHLPGSGGKPASANPFFRLASPATP